MLQHCLLICRLVTKKTATATATTKTLKAELDSEKTRVYLFIVFPYIAISDPKKHTNT